MSFVVDYSAVSEHDTHAVSIYPNPATSILSYTVSDNAKVKGVSIFDMKSTEILSFEGDPKTLDIGRLKSGEYVLHIETQNGLLIYPFVKK